jgi:hypothetical protein
MTEAHPPQDIRILIPLTQQGGMISLQTREIGSREFRGFSHGFMRGNKLMHAVRPDQRAAFCETLDRLCPVHRPYELWFNDEDQEWTGDSFQLGAYIAHCRQQSGLAAALFPWVCATGVISSQGNIGALENGLPNALLHKLEQLLQYTNLLQHFIYPSDQQFSNEERQLLDRLKKQGIQTHAYAKVSDLPTALTGKKPPNRRPWQFVSKLLLGAAALALSASWLSDVTDTDDNGPEWPYPPLIQKSSKAPQLNAPTPIFSFTELKMVNGQPSCVGKTNLVRNGDRLDAGCLKGSFTAPGNGVYYAFSRFSEANGDSLLIEEFRIKGLERNLITGQGQSLPPDGLALDDSPGSIELTLVALPTADPELQALIERLPPNGSRDPAFQQRLNKRLLDLPDRAIQRITFTQ